MITLKRFRGIFETMREAREFVEMTPARILQLNGDMTGGSPMMEVVRRIHALCYSREIPYCVIGGMAVIRNGYARTTIDVDVLTLKKNWLKALPIEGEIASEGIDNCLDKETGVRIDILFADEDWGMVIPMPDPRRVAEFDEPLGANFIGLHALVQLKTAVYLDKLREHGPTTAAKDLADVQALIKNNLDRFSREMIEGYDPAVRKLCIGAFDEVARETKSLKKKRRDIEL
jgi:hypothetical protein